MLVLKRRAGQHILLAGTIRITVLKVQKTCVELGIDAPRTTHILRGELAPAKISQELPRLNTSH